MLCSNLQGCNRQQVELYMMIIRRPGVRRVLHVISVQQARIVNELAIKNLGHGVLHNVAVGTAAIVLAGIYRY